MLAERGIDLLAERGTGYSLATTHRQLTVLQDRTRRAVRQVKRGRRSVASLPVEELSEHQCRVRAFMIGAAAATEDTLKQSLKGQETQFRPTPIPERRPFPEAASA
jgi:hypothetical protein